MGTHEILVKRAREAIRKVHDDRTVDADQVLQALDELSDYVDELSGLLYESIYARVEDGR